jgi:phosphinothricin acetyltransferase
MPGTDAIRLATPDDAPAIAGIYRPIVEGTTISFEAIAPTEAEMRQRVTETLTVYPWLVLEDAGGVLAYAYGCRHRARAAYQWSVETSVYVDERHRGRGLGRRLYATLLELLAAQGFANAYAGIALPNPASVALHERIGFRRIGVFPRVGYKFGEWWDVGWWYRPLSERTVTPSISIPVTDVLNRPEWAGRLKR